MAFQTTGLAGHEDLPEVLTIRDEKYLECIINAFIFIQNISPFLIA